MSIYIIPIYVFVCSDEVGFIHPSQFAKLTEEAGDDIATPSSDDATFWSRDHKLGVSTQVLLPLYNAAKHAFMAAIGEYKRLGDDVVSDDRVESEVMMHSRALLLLSSDFGTAWNSRSFSGHYFATQLKLVAICYNPKSQIPIG